MRRETKVIAYLISITLAFICTKNAVAQRDPLYSQYYLNPMAINPGFTGFGNTLSADITARQQWLGFEGAPTSLLFSLHSPINATRGSIGLDILRSQAGPLVSNHVAFNYSYMIRLADRMLMTVGMSAGVNQQQLLFSDLNIGAINDPNFTQPYLNQLVTTVGIGGVLLTPIFYVGISSPNIPITYIDLEQTNGSSLPIQRHYYFTGGASAPSYHKFVAKFSFITRYVEKSEMLIDNTLQIIYNDFIGIGATYRYGHSYGMLLRIQANRNLGLMYSYDMALSKPGYIAQGSHEITLSYDNFKLYRRNKYRVFKRKKEVVEEAYKSIRYF